MKSKIFYGADGARMLNDALLEAREILKTDNLLTHPDYVFVEPAGKKQIGVEDVLPVVSKGLDRPVLADVAVAVINGFDALTVAAQNKLLLTLEANVNVLVIGIAKNLGSVLDTVKSRVELIEYKRAGREEFSEFENPELAFQSFCGDLQLAKSRKADYGTILQVRADCLDNPSGLLKTLHLVEEKDPDAVTNDRVLLPVVLQAMKCALAERAAMKAAEGNAEKAIVASECVRRLDEEEALMRRPSYSKDDFFLAVVDVIENIK